MDKRQRKGSVQNLPEGLEAVNLNAAGIDVGATAHFVAVPGHRDEQPVREFGAFTGDLHRLADWLERCRIETVVLESTGVYWIPLYELLEAQGFEVKLVDTRQLRRVPGRKTDVVDCQWLQQLHTYGLLSGAFRPEEAVTVLRGYLRHRATLVAYASHHIQHMQKALTLMNVKLQHVVSDVTGKTGMGIVRAILSGERRPEELVKLRDRRCKESAETIRKALEGNWREEHLFQLAQAVELFEVYHEKITACDERIEACLKRFSDRSGGRELEPKPRQRKVERNAPRFDLRGHLFRMTGVDLTQVDGIDTSTVLTIVSECGLDMSRWPTAKHFASWLGLCPGSKISGGRRLSTRSKQSASRLATALRLAAQTLHRSKSALGAFYRRKRAHLGAPKAITATAHKLARIIYTMLSTGREYADLGADHYEAVYRERLIGSLQRRAREFGYKLIADQPLELTPPPR